MNLVQCPIAHNATSLNGCVEANNTTFQQQQVINAAMRFSTLSNCSSYYGLPGTYTENETRWAKLIVNCYNKFIKINFNRYLCKNPYLRSNVRVIMGAIVLSLVGLTLLIFGLFVMLYPNDMGMFFFKLKKSISSALHY